MTTVLSNFPLGAFLNIEQTHFDHGPLEIKEKHGLVERITADNASSSGAPVKGLVGCENSGLPYQSVEVIVIEGVSARVEGLLRVVASAACSGQGLGKVGVYIWVNVMRGIKVAQPAFE